MQHIFKGKLLGKLDFGKALDKLSKNYIISNMIQLYYSH